MVTSEWTNRLLKILRKPKIFFICGLAVVGQSQWKPKSPIKFPMIVFKMQFQFIFLIEDNKRKKTFSAVRVWLGQVTVMSGWMWKKIKNLSHIVRLYMFSTKQLYHFLLGAEGMILAIYKWYIAEFKINHLYFFF